MFLVTLYVLAQTGEGIRGRVHGEYGRDEPRGRQAAERDWSSWRTAEN